MNDGYHDERRKKRLSVLQTRSLFMTTKGYQCPGQRSTRVVLVISHPYLSLSLCLFLGVRRFSFWLRWESEVSFERLITTKIPSKQTLSTMKSMAPLMMTERRISPQFLVNFDSCEVRMDENALEL